ATETAAPLFTDSVLQEKVSAGNMSIYPDRDGMIWCGSLAANGIYQLIPFTASVTRTEFPLQQVYPKMTIPFTAVKLADSGRLWVGTLEGLVLYDPKTGAKTARTFAGTPSRKLIPLGVDQRKQKAVVATFDCRIYEVDLQTKNAKQVTVFDLNHKALEKACLEPATFTPYKNGFLFWSDKIGVFTLNTETAVAQQLFSVPYHVTNMALAGNDRIFLRLHFGYTNLSFYEKGGRWQQTPTALDSIEWVSIKYDKDDNTYWVGGIKQLYHFDHRYRLIRSYTEKDGLPGMHVLGFEKDNAGNIWFVSNHGSISQVNAKTGLLTSLSEKDGYEGQLFGWQAPHVKDGEGNIYFAGTKGLDRIQPQKVDSFPAARVYFRSLSVNEKPITLSAGLNGATRLSLRYSEMPLVIETGVIDYYAKGRVNIRYRLQELSNVWQYAPANYVIRFEKLPPGHYTLVLQASGSGNNFKGPEKLLLLSISPAFWNTGWFRVGAVIFLSLLAYAFLRRRVKQQFRLQLERAEKERQLAELKHKAMELEMQALRAQMNPHFIFNSLNSINRFILQNDKDQASEYLIKFSRLIRLILQNSQASLISLESELESLRLYLDLEAFRFHHHFDYKISVPENIEVADLQVPPLILQPYVENAIWHGLMHREETGQLDIDL
ncbi:MAG TPA: histidine kinase, partial [Flavisolibacter sp.]|nr:histidine kinase [Flavisolibacter sp.]